MSLQVFFKSARLSKTFATVLTPIKFFASVNSLVCFKVPALSKTVETKTAMKWFLTRVDSHVNLIEKKGHLE